MPRPHPISILAVVSLLAACTPSTTPGETEDTTTGGTSSGAASSGSTTAPGSSSDETSPGGTSPGGTSPGGTSLDTDDDTAGEPTGGGELECEWSFVDELDMPRMRGVGTEDQTCNPVTTDTIALEVQLDLPDGYELAPTASVQLLLFEYDPLVADSSADCVGGLCGLLEGADPVWTFDVPNDLPELEYYISVDLDDGNGCVLNEVDFVTFSPAQGTLMVPMTASNCI
jgi:hypothetical protein